MTIVTRRWLLLPVAIFALFGFGGRAHAYVYFAGQGRIGRAGNDGATVEPEFISGIPGFTCGIAVDSHHIYWADVGIFPTEPSIGRANLDGTEVEPEFISLPGTDPCGIAVDSSHIYWTDMTGRVGKAKLDGENVEPEWAAASEACGVAIGPEGLYVAYGGFGIEELATSGPSEGEVMSHVETTGRCGVAYDAPYVYWANGGPGSTGTTIGRAEAGFLIAPDNTWLTTTVDHETRPWSVAVHGGELYYAPYAGSIGRFKTDGTQSLEPSFIPTSGDVAGIAVDDLPPPISSPPPPTSTPPTTPSGGTSSTGGKPTPPPAPKLLLTTIDRSTGTATVTLRVQSAGTAVLSGKAVKTDRETAKHAGKLNLAVHPKGAAARALKQSGHVRVSFTIAFTPKGGTKTHTKGSVKLIKS